jgi:hypothetical protein
MIATSGLTNDHHWELEAWFVVISPDFGLQHRDVMPSGSLNDNSKQSQILARLAYILELSGRRAIFAS